VYRIDRIVSASANIMCITADSAAVNTGRITQEINGHSRPVNRQARGLEGQEEGDCNLIPASSVAPRRSTGSWPPVIDDATPPPPAGTDNNSLNCQLL